MDWHYLFVFALLLGNVSSMVMQKCEPITNPKCMNLPYNETIYPNLLNHESQEDAGLELHQFYPLIEMNCSPDLRLFLCTMHMPVCTALDKYLPPCRSLCENARAGCDRLMEQFGYSWPELMKCSKFPEFDGSGSCIIGKTYAPTVATTPKRVQKLRFKPFRTTIAPEVVKINIQDAVETDQQLSTNQSSAKMIDAVTSLPTTPSSAHSEIWAKEQFEAMPDHDLLVFNAMSMLQLLQDNAKLREEVTVLKKKVDTTCNNKTNSGIDSNNGNSKRPKSSPYQNQTLNTTNSQISGGKCRPITIKLCMDMPYNETMTPNLLNNQSQEDIASELREFSPLVKLKCSPDLNFFLCTVYAPMRTSLNHVIPPCRSLCESAKMGCEKLSNNFGFEWPESMNCSKFPEFGGSGSCVSRNGSNYLIH